MGWGWGVLGQGDCCSLESTLNAMWSAGHSRTRGRCGRCRPPASNQLGVPSQVLVEWMGPPNVQIFTAAKRVKLMEPQTQKISGEMNCATKARSICTDKSMKNGAGKCFARTAEQVNCPFCLLWESIFSPQMQPYVFGS